MTVTPARLFIHAFRFLLNLLRSRRVIPATANCQSPIATVFVFTCCRCCCWHGCCHYRLASSTPTTLAFSFSALHPHHAPPFFGISFSLCFVFACTPKPENAFLVFFLALAHPAAFCINSARRVQLRISWILTRVCSVTLTVAVRSQLETFSILYK